MAWCLRSDTLPLQYISLVSILASALFMMLQRFGMICLMMYVLPLLFTHLERSSKLISLTKHAHSNFCFSHFLSVVLTSVMFQVNDYGFLLFLYGAPRVCLQMEIKHYKYTIAIIISILLMYLSKWRRLISFHWKISLMGLPIICLLFVLNCICMKGCSRILVWFWVLYYY